MHSICPLPAHVLAVVASAMAVSAQSGTVGAEAGLKTPKVGWKPGSGCLLADSDDFRLQMSGQIQVQWSYAAVDSAIGSASDDDWTTFTVRRANMSFTGHAFTKHLTYLLRVAGAENGYNNGPLKDAWSQYDFVHGASRVGVRVGQSRPYFGLEFTQPITATYFTGLSSATSTLSAMRTQGAWVMGSVAKNSLRWNLGAQNADVASGLTGVAERGEEVANTDGGLDYVGNVSFDPFGDITGGKTNESLKQGDLGEVKQLGATIGASVQAGNHRNVINTQDVDSMSLNLNTAWQFGGGWTAQGEVYARTDDPQDTGSTERARGWYAMGTYTVPASGSSLLQWGFGLRFSHVETDDTATYCAAVPGLGGLPGATNELSGVVDTFYWGYACKGQFEYTLQEASPDVGNRGTNHIFRVLWQVLF